MKVKGLSIALLIAVTFLLASVFYVGGIAGRAQGGSGEKDAPAANKSTTRPRPRTRTRSRRTSTVNANRSTTNANRSTTPIPVTTTAASLAGTSWSGPDSTGDFRRFTFTSNGLLNNTSTDTWRQEGNKIYWEINNAYSHYEGTIYGDRIDYSAYNKVNLRWTGTLTRTSGSTTPTTTATNFRGLNIRIVHIHDRLADAQIALARLRNLGAEAYLYETSDSGNAEWQGKIVYWEGQEDLARRIASSVSDIEAVTPKFVSDTENKRTFYLWIANRKQTSTSEANFRGVNIRIVHTRQRLADAQTALARLQTLGADAYLYETSDSGNEEWTGRIVYWEGQETLARRIASSVSDIEVVTPKFVSDTENKRTFYLWIANRKQSSTNEANFSGVSVRIVHIRQRLADAQIAAARLRGLGAQVELYETSDTGNGDWMGKIVYWEGQEALAQRIANSVSDIEVVTPKFSSDTEGKRTFYLWIARPR